MRLPSYYSMMSLQSLHRPHSGVEQNTVYSDLALVKLLS